MPFLPDWTTGEGLTDEEVTSPFILSLSVFCYDNTMPETERQFIKNSFIWLMIPERWSWHCLVF